MGSEGKENGVDVIYRQARLHGYVTSLRFNLNIRLRLYVLCSHDDTAHTL